MENKYLVPLAIATIAIITGSFFTQPTSAQESQSLSFIGKPVFTKDEGATLTIFGGDPNNPDYSISAIDGGPNDPEGGYQIYIENDEIIVPAGQDFQGPNGHCGIALRVEDKTTGNTGEITIEYDDGWGLIAGTDGNSRTEDEPFRCEVSGKAQIVSRSTFNRNFYYISGKYKVLERIGNLGRYCCSWGCSAKEIEGGTYVPYSNTTNEPIFGNPYDRLQGTEENPIKLCLKDYACEDFGGDPNRPFESGVCSGWSPEHRINCSGGGGAAFYAVGGIKRQQLYERDCTEPQLPTEDPCQDTPSFSLSTFTDTQGEGGTTYKAGDMVLATAEGGTGNCNIKTTANGWDSEIPFSLAKNQDDCVFGGVIPDNCTCDKCPSFTVEIDDGCNTETETFQCGCENTTPIKITVDGINIDAIPDYSRGSKFEMEASGGGGGPYEWKVITEGWTIDNKIDYEGSGSRMPIEIPIECTEETCPGIKIEVKDECENKSVSMTIACAEGDTRTRYDQYSGCHNLYEAQQQVCRQKKWEVADQNQPGYPIMYLDEECAKCSKEGLTRVCFKELSWFGLEKEKDCCETAKDHIRWTCTNGTWQTTALNPNDYQVCAIEDSIRPSKEQEQLIKNAPDCFNSQQDMFDYFAKNGVLKQDNQMRYFCNQDYCMQNVRYFINKPKKGVEVKEYNYRGSIKIKSVLNNNDFDNAFFDVTIGMKKNSPVYKQYKKQNSHKNYQIEQHYVDKSLPHTKEYLEEVSKFKGNDIQILAQIYNYLGDNYTYDFCLLNDRKNADRSNGFEDALKNKNMICIDYSLAVRLACEIHGINATLESTNVHVWNRHVFPSCDGGFFVFNGDATWHKTFTPLPERIPQTHL